MRPASRRLNGRAGQDSTGPCKVPSTARALAWNGLHLSASRRPAASQPWQDRTRVRSAPGQTAARKDVKMARRRRNPADNCKPQHSADASASQTKAKPRQKKSLARRQGVCSLLWSRFDGIVEGECQKCPASRCVAARPEDAHAHACWGQRRQPARRRGTAPCSYAPKQAAECPLFAEAVNYALVFLFLSAHVHGFTGQLGSSPASLLLLPMPCASSPGPERLGGSRCCASHLFPPTPSPAPSPAARAGLNLNMRLRCPASQRWQPPSRIPDKIGERKKGAAQARWPFQAPRSPSCHRAVNLAWWTDTPSARLSPPKRPLGLRKQR